MQHAKMRIAGVITVLAAVSCLLGRAFARELYVSPTGTPTNDGSQEKPLDLTTALSARSPARPGDTIYLMAGTYEGPLKERDGKTERLPFEFAVSGSAEKPIRVMPAPGATVHINGTVELTSSHVHYIGLEIGDLRWDPEQKTHRNQPALNATAGTQAKFINCNLFGGSMGTGIWRGAIDFEMYGCLVHDFGTLGADRGHGHAVYTQNDTGTKRYEHNIFYRGCGWNFDIYGQQGQMRGFDVIENISYAGGWYKPGQVSFSYGISGYQPADRVRFLGNVAYQPRDGQRWRGNFRLIVHQRKEVSHVSGEVRDNYIMGGWRGFGLGYWKDITVTGNTIWSTGIIAEIAAAPGGAGINDPALPRPDLKNYHFDNNTYYDNGQPKPFRYGGGVEKESEEELLTFAEWQALGLDRNGRMLPGRNGRPTGTKVFIFPNKYQKGRAHLAVFNWDDLEQVEVDLSPALAPGQRYQVYNCLNIKQTIALARPVAEGVWQGGKVALPMKKDAASPQFDAFLVLPVE